MHSEENISQNHSGANESHELHADAGFNIQIGIRRVIHSFLQQTGIRFVPVRRKAMLLIRTGHTDDTDSEKQSFKDAQQSVSETVQMQDMRKMASYKPEIIRFGDSRE